MNLRNPAHPGELLTGWLALQTQRNLWTARQTAKDRKRIKRMAVPEPVTA